MTTPTFGDRVQEIFTTTGTGTISLGGAVSGYQPFSGVMSNNGTCYYMATDGTNWEVGLGTYATGGNTLARTTVQASSNGGAAVSWAAGTKSISMVFPAAAAAAAAGGLTVGTSAIAGGTGGNILYDNSGVLGELGTTGSGNVVRATSPTLVTPALGTPASGNLSNCTGVPVGIMTALAVGSIIMASSNSFTNLAAGGTVSGASLGHNIYFDFSQNGGTAGMPQNGDTISGTWQALQFLNSSGSHNSGGLFQRIS